MRPTDTSINTVLAFSTDAALRRRFMVVDEPIPGNLRFGLTLELLDKLAEEAALAYVRQFHEDVRVVTAAIDSIRVRRPADVNRDLCFSARVNYVGRSSMEVGIRMEQGENHIASSYFTMVARDCSLPPLEVKDALVSAVMTAPSSGESSGASSRSRCCSRRRARNSRCCCACTPSRNGPRSKDCGSAI